MNNKKTGLECILSVILSLSVLSATIFFSGELVGFISNFTLGAVAVFSGVDNLEKENTKKTSQNNIIGFGNSYVEENNAVDTKTPEDIEKLMEEAVAAYASFTKTGDIDETTLSATSTTISSSSSVLFDH